MNARLKKPVGPDDHIIGSARAPLTLVEYGDFECPHCGHAFPIVERLRETLGPELRVVFRHFPLTQIHPNALLAAQASEAAALQGHFWQMHDLLFENQGKLSRATFLRFADQLKLNRAAFEEALRDEAITKKVRRDFRDGVRSGANGTPTFFINGARYDGSFEFEPMLAALRRELEEKQQTAARP